MSNPSIVSTKTFILGIILTYGLFSNALSQPIECNDEMYIRDLAIIPTATIPCGLNAQINSYMGVFNAVTIGYNNSISYTLGTQRYLLDSKNLNLFGVKGMIYSSYDHSTGLSIAGFYRLGTQPNPVEYGHWDSQKFNRFSAGLLGYHKPMVSTTLHGSIYFGEWEVGRFIQPTFGIQYTLSKHLTLSLEGVAHFEMSSFSLPNHTILIERKTPQIIVEENVDTDAQPIFSSVDPNYERIFVAPYKQPTDNKYYFSPTIQYKMYGLLVDAGVFGSVHESSVYMYPYVGIGYQFRNRAPSSDSLLNTEQLSRQEAYQTRLRVGGSLVSGYVDYKRLDDFNFDYSYGIESALQLRFPFSRYALITELQLSYKKLKGIRPLWQSRGEEITVESSAITIPVLLEYRLLKRYYATMGSYLSTQIFEPKLSYPSDRYNAYGYINDDFSVDYKRVIQSGFIIGCGYTLSDIFTIDYRYMRSLVNMFKNSRLLFDSEKERFDSFFETSHTISVIVDI